MIAKATTVRCLTCNTPCPHGLAAEFAKAWAEKAPPSMSEKEAIAHGTLMMMVGFMLQHHAVGECALHTIGIENHLMMCKHHGEADCNCPSSSLVTETAYYADRRAH